MHAESPHMVLVNTDSPVRPPSRNAVSARAWHSCASSKTAVAAPMLLVALLLGRPLAAQRTPADSLAERLRRAEAAIAALQVQIAEQAQGGVRARSGARIELSGRLMVKA